MSDSAKQIRDIWRRIESVLQTHSPGTAKTLASPATDREIVELELAIHLTLPTDFHESLKIHNGQDDPTRCHSFSGEGILLSTKQIADRWQMVTEIDEEEFRRSPLPPGQGPWWKATCIPFTDAEGNMLCIDMDPALGNRIGEVVCHVHDSEIESGIAISYADWLSSLAARLDSGRYRIDEHGYLWLDIDTLGM